MPATYSYPGIYIQELPLSTQTITPAPTSITAFVGYTHPWKTLPGAFHSATQIFSFSDYEAFFGGLYTTGVVDAAVARAVYAFFLNGGNNAYVVALPLEAAQFGVGPDDVAFRASLLPNAAVATSGIQIVAIEPADMVPMRVKVANIRVNSATNVFSIFDLVVTYGTRVEVYRGLDLGVAAGAPGSLDLAINGVSSLITVGPIGAGTSYGAFLVTGGVPVLPATPVVFTLGTQAAPASGVPAGATPLAASDFLPVFLPNSSLDNVEIFNLLLVPGVSDVNILSAALAFAERKLAFAIIDPPPQATAVGVPGVSPPQDIGDMANNLPLSQNGALYFPYLTTTDPITSLPMPVAPSGFVAGVFAATDSSRGVWKAPAGLATTLLGTTGPVTSGIMNDAQQGVLYAMPNSVPVNCLRSFSGAGTVVYGARTLVGGDNAFAASKYVPVRRMTLFIEQTLVANLKWVVFEPNDEPLWLAIKSSIESFLLALFNQSALQGATPSAAFQVKCDSTTTAPADQQLGIVNIVIGVALLKPAEYVVITISQMAGQTS